MLCLDGVYRIIQLMEWSASLPENEDSHVGPHLSSERRRRTNGNKDLLDPYSAGTILDHR